MPKSKSFGDKVVRGGPLGDDIVNALTATASRRQKNKKRKDDEDKYVGSDLSKKILSQAQKQQLELEEEYGAGSGSGSSMPRQKPRKKTHKILVTQEEDDEEDDEKEMAEGMMGPVELDPEDEKVFETFMPKKGHRSLAETVQSLVQEKKTEIDTVLSDDREGRIQDVDPQIANLYRKIGEVLKRYRSGKLPIPFKTLPRYQLWEQCLCLTAPEQWTAAAMYAATKIFSSNLPASLSQRFYSLILLPRIRDDIQEYGRLNFHLMTALKKSLFKTSAFFKGIVLSLCESGDCTLREAIIISSVIRESSIPVAHAGAAIDRIARMDYTGASSIFLRTLLDKKYALSYAVVDTVCDHFFRFLDDERKMPVLWHQSLLTFVQRHKNDLRQKQKQQLYNVITCHFHQEISPEIRRELENSTCRDASTVNMES